MFKLIVVTVALLATIQASHGQGFGGQISQGAFGGQISGQGPIGQGPFGQGPFGGQGPIQGQYNGGLGFGGQKMGQIGQVGGFDKGGFQKGGFEKGGMGYEKQGPYI